MALKPIDLIAGDEPVPDSITQFLDETERYVERHRVNTSTSYRGFVPSDYRLVYQYLAAIYHSSLLTGERFCEWGSGVGVVCSLASLVGFESFGIEFNDSLVEVAEDLRDQHSLSVELISGSYVPPGSERAIDAAFSESEGELSLHIESDRTYDELGYDVADFDLIFCFPWPNDVDVTFELFDQSAASGALLLIYFSTESVGLFRKD